MQTDHPDAMRRALVAITVTLAGAAVASWLYWQGTRYVIVAEHTYPPSSPSTGIVRGYAVRTSADLQSALSNHGVDAGEMSIANVNFPKEFVFVVENGTLLKISHGYSGFDVAVIKPSSNMSLTVVRGPNRPLKAVVRERTTR